MELRTAIQKLLAAEQEERGTGRTTRMLELVRQEVYSGFEPGFRPAMFQFIDGPSGGSISDEGPKHIMILAHSKKFIRDIIVPKFHRLLDSYNLEYEHLSHRVLTIVGKHHRVWFRDSAEELRKLPDHTMVVEDHHRFKSRLEAFLRCY